MEPQTVVGKVQKLSTDVEALDKKVRIEEKVNKQCRRSLERSDERLRESSSDLENKANELAGLKERIEDAVARLARFE
ncbi:MAG: hypothetical protein GY804_07005 [Alphaproteobacteria bacterium]|nr:hypothetical protein [Alphaproteobacteria bacterium]